MNQPAGVRRQVVVRSLDRLTAAAASWTTGVGEIGFDDAATARLSELIDTRRRELLDPA